MAVLQAIRNLLIPFAEPETETVVPAAATSYVISPLAEKDLEELLRLNMRCFKNGENYTKHTFAYLLSEPNALSYQIVTADDQMAGFVCVLIGDDGAAHITTIGIAPEHRRRRLAEKLLAHLEKSLKAKGVGAIVLEVRVSNTAAQNLYKRRGFSVVQRINRYYNNGEDGFLMMRSLI
jgi:ribosomal-protein-alanine N-acetyltransferase